MRLRSEIETLNGFFSSRRLISWPRIWVDDKVIACVYQRLREALFHVAELEGVSSGTRSDWNITSSGGKRKASAVFGLLERDSIVYARVS